MTVLLIFLAAYYAATLVWYGSYLTAGAHAFPPPPSKTSQQEEPLLIVVAPCRRGAESIAGMAASLKLQHYPPERYRLIILIDRDESLDPSADIARAGGAEVYERRNPEVKTKGAAVNELLERQLKNQLWDALVVLDIDARMGPEFLAYVAAYLSQGAQILQTAPLSKNPSGSEVSRISHAGQLLSQAIQRGRSALGQSAILSGTGMVFSRQSLERLGWETSTGRRISDDGELNLRCLLDDIPVSYGPHLTLMNDMPTDVQAVRLQRRRWFAARVEAFSYIVPLLRKGLSGQWRALEGLFTFILLPGSSLAFVLAGCITLTLGLCAVRNPHYFAGWFWLFAALWTLHTLIYIRTLRRVDGLLSLREFLRLPAFLAMRAVALIEGMILASRTNPGRHAIPAEHKEPVPLTRKEP